MDRYWNLEGGNWWYWSCLFWNFLRIFFFFLAFSFDDRSIQVCGILGQPSSCHFSSMIPIQIGPMTKENPSLLSLDPPVNPLGRDIPRKWKVTTFCTLDRPSVEHPRGRKEPDWVHCALWVKWGVAESGSVIPCWKSTLSWSELCITLGPRE